MKGGAIKRKVVTVALTALALTGATVLSAGAASSGTGIVTGRVAECGPGPIVATPGFPTPTPTPSAVILVHHHVAYATQTIVFPLKQPWVGSFSFTVPAGHYEVISTYEGDVRRIVVKAGSTSVVDLGSSVCPQ